jgi:hypothetical protein
MFQLRWDESVSRELLDAAARSDPARTDEILSAMAEIEGVLSESADTVGESREPGTRFCFYPPLAITFKVNVRLREVRVVRALIHRPRKS